MPATTKVAQLDAPMTFAHADIPAVTRKVRDGAPVVLRGIQKFCGATLGFAGLLLLVFPFGASSTTEILLKMMFALILGFSGAALWQAGTSQMEPEMELDMVRREIRMVHVRGTRRNLAMRRKFSDLSGVKMDGAQVQFWDEDNTLLADISIADPATRSSLQRALRGEGISV